MNNKFLVVSLLMASLITMPSLARKPYTAKAGDMVRVEYIGKVDDGIIFDTNLGQPPLSFVIGDGTVLKGFEDSVVGLAAGSKTTINIPADYAYGAVNLAKIMQVPRAQIPTDLAIEEGTNLVLQGPEGSMLVRVVEISDTEVVLDANHLLAGKDLNFEVKLLEVMKQGKKKS